jgi:hypothetical protein
LEQPARSTSSASTVFDQPLAVFAEGRLGDDEAEVWAGLRVYLGRPNALINRHRQDDPAVSSLDFLFESTVTPTATVTPPEVEEEEEPE